MVSTGDDVTLFSGFNILDASGDADADIHADDIRLVAGGSIGELGNPVDIISNTLTATAEKDIFLNELVDQVWLLIWVI